jgi:hypothetical protein
MQEASSCTHCRWPWSPGGTWARRRSCSCCTPGSWTSSPLSAAGRGAASVRRVQLRTCVPWQQARAAARLTGLGLMGPMSTSVRVQAPVPTYAGCRIERGVEGGRWRAWARLLGCAGYLSTKGPSSHPVQRIPRAANEHDSESSERQRTPHTAGRRRRQPTGPSRTRD